MKSIITTSLKKINLCSISVNADYFDHCVKQQHKMSFLSPISLLNGQDSGRLSDKKYGWLEIARDGT
jgi:hypothetical protein